MKTILAAAIFTVASLSLTITDDKEVDTPAPKAKEATVVEESALIMAHHPVEVEVTNDDDDIEVTISPPPEDDVPIDVTAIKDEDIAPDVNIDEPKGPLPAAIGEPVKWAARNLDCWKGWSLTGYSWGGLTARYNPWRFKIGMVSGEWEASRQKWMADNERWTDFRRYETRFNDDIIFGISFTVRF